jgi:hypothetical protein
LPKIRLANQTLDLVILILSCRPAAENNDNQ